jgi:predicted acetyltransferase
VRLLDVPASLTARTYNAPGRLVLDVIDDELGYANGRFVLEAEGDGASCAPTELEPDLQLTHRVLASIYLGGFTLRQLQIAGDVHEITAGSIDRADLMFSTHLAPWNATGF